MRRNVTAKRRIWSLSDLLYHDFGFKNNLALMLLL